MPPAETTATRSTGLSVDHAYGAGGSRRTAGAGHATLDDHAHVQHPRATSKLATTVTNAGETAIGIRDDEPDEDEADEVAEAEDDDQEHTLPRDARILSLLLASMGVTEADRRVVPQLLEFAHRYTVDVLRDAQIYSEHAVKNEIDLDDVRLAIQGRINHAFTSPPEKELIMDLAKEKNQIPLPLIPEKYGIRLPPERHCLTAVNFSIVSAKLPPSGKTMSSPATNGPGKATPPEPHPSNLALKEATSSASLPPQLLPTMPSAEDDDEDEEMEEVPAEPSKDDKATVNAVAVEMLARKRLLDEDDDYDS